jgi:hypothetical protein
MWKRLSRCHYQCGHLKKFNFVSTVTDFSEVLAEYQASSKLYSTVCETTIDRHLKALRYRPLKLVKV